LKLYHVICQVGLHSLALLISAPAQEKIQKIKQSQLKEEPSLENKNPINTLAGSQDMENHSILNATESNWASMVGLVPTVDSRDLKPINKSMHIYRVQVRTYCLSLWKINAKFRWNLVTPNTINALFKTLAKFGKGRGFHSHRSLVVSLYLIIYMAYGLNYIYVGI
jgi:hypothetical protein